jgi:hypothetical protein
LQAWQIRIGPATTGRFGQAQPAGPACDADVAGVKPSPLDLMDFSTPDLLSGSGIGTF